MSSIPWNRDAVVCCYCSALRYVHSHCPCHKCNGKAVSRSTEYRHWKEEWLLPTRCTFCKEVISANNISEALGVDGQRSDLEDVQIKCPYCATQFHHCLRYTRGDPRNIALIGHWDGWQPFSTSAKHSCGSIEVQIATMCKLDRSNTDEVYVCGFVPCYMVPNSMPWSLDPFLHPLITEIEDAFIDGIHVDYRGKVAGLEPGNTRIWCLLLCWTGDHPAQCEVGKFLSSGGIHACRRDKLEGVRVDDSHQYYYGDYRFHYRNLWPERTLDDPLSDMGKVDQEDRITVRRKLVSQVGFTGLSILHRLYRLYKFDVIKDMVFDTMHTLILRVVQRHLQFYLDKAFFRNSVLDTRLRAMPWTAELKDGRVPEGVTSRLGYWKAEELQKFAFPASEHVLSGILPDDHYHVWMLIVRITEMLFGYGRNGLTTDDLQLLKKLVWRHNILTEEVEGIRNCTISLHNLIHLPSDIEHFSTPDNVWCYVFERAVHTYVERSSNKKNLELTIARAQSRHELLKFLPTKVDCIQEGNLQQPFHASSIVQARKCYPNLLVGQHVLVGGKKCTTIKANELQCTSVFSHLQFEGSDVPAISCRSLLMYTQAEPRGILFRVGEHVLIRSDLIEQVIHVINFFSICNSGEHYTIVKGSLFNSYEENPDSTTVIASSTILLANATNILCKILTTAVLQPVML